MRALSLERSRSLPALTGALLLVAVAAAQIPGAPAALVIALGAAGLLATFGQALRPALGVLRRHRSMVLLALLALALSAWIAVGLIDAGGTWNPYNLVGGSLANGSPYPASGYYWPPIQSWPWRINGTPLWPLVLGLICVGGGFALIADAVRVSVGLARPSRSRWRALTAAPTRGGRITARAVPGLVLIVCAAFLGIGLVDSAAADRPALQTAGTFIVGAIAVVLVISPVAVGLSLRLTFDKASLARERERQRFAAHLHDSVLQTLALIQRQAAEPEAVIKLASRQEHALRAWMAGEADLGSVTVTSAVREMLVEIEDEHGLKPELTVIGDAKLDQRGEELVAAAREALRNVARHAPNAPVNVFLDISAAGTELFVRDSGPGFSFAAVPVERRGLRDSVIGRMHSVGGDATVDSTPGEDGDRAAPTGGERKTPMSSEMAGTLRVVVVDDHHLFRAGVRAELASQCDVVGEASRPAEAVEVIAATDPDVVLLDVHLPEGGGLAVLAQLAERGIASRVLALSVSDSAEDVVPMIRAGALGYVTKTIETSELIHALRSVAGGDVYFSPRLAAFVLQAFSGRTPAEPTAPGLEDLTPREREVLHHLARGYAYKQIGVRLGISARTVESHVGAVLRKLQLTSRHEVTRWAASRGLVQLADTTDLGPPVKDL